MGTRENEFQSSENLHKHRQNFIISFIFVRLVLLKMIFFEEIFKTVIQKFAIR